MIRTASLSDCRRYRWHLWRIWNPYGGFVVFIGLNPSTADETLDDATIRRCIAFAKLWGYGGLCMLNAHAWRDRHPSGLLTASDSVGWANDKVLRLITGCSSLNVACWGNHGAIASRGEAVRELLKDRQLHAFRLTKAGHPEHPLYLPANLEPKPWL